MSTFDRDIHDGAITTKEANEDQSYFLVEILSFRK